MSKKLKRRMIIFDTTYTYEYMMKHDLISLVTSRDINGYFDHVWTVHSVAALFYPTSSGLRYGRPVIRKLNDRHTHIEGKMGRFKSLSWIAPLNFLFAQVDLIFLLLKLVKQKRITIIRADDPHFNGIFGLIISVICKLPLIVACWGNCNAIRKSTKKPLSGRLKWIRLEEIIEKFIFRRADMVIAGNIDNMNFVKSYGLHENKTALVRIGNHINKSHFIAPSKRESGIADLELLGISDHKVLMCISRLETLKYPDHLIRSLACLKNKDLNIKALFVGEGASKDSLIALAEELEVSNNIVFCNNRDQDWLLRVLPCVDVVVSILTGRALVETALAGSPIVAYDIDWQSEVIETGITGELVPSLDYSIMADAIQKILKDEKYALMIGSNVRERMFKMMNPEAINQMQIDIYEKLLGPKVPDV